jgi:curved DNA-binding protein CbpA
MATMAGYNPNVSLLPNAGGSIQAMSGGGAPPGFNPSISLLPSAGGEINSYKGGFFDQEVQIIGGQPPAAGPVPRTASAPAAGPGAARVPRRPPVAPQPDAQPPPPTGAPAQPPAAPGDAAQPPEAPKPPEAAKPEESKPEKDEKDEKTKNIVIFGKSLVLEDPRKMASDVLTESQVEALKLFGLDGDKVSDKDKREIIIALFDGKCNTDKPLIFLQNCEPIRRVVQSLALNLLSHLKNTEGPGLEGVDKEPKVTLQELDDGSLKVCIQFDANQLSLLSKFIPKRVINAKKAKKANKPAAAPKPAERPEGEEPEENNENNESENGNNDAAALAAAMEEAARAERREPAGLAPGEPPLPRGPPAGEEPPREGGPPAPGRLPAGEEPPREREPPAPAGLPAGEEPPREREPPAPAGLPAGEEPPREEGPPAPAGLPAGEEPPREGEPPAPAAAERDFYQILGSPRFTVPSVANYRRLSRNAHPNRGGEPGQQTQINRAWEVLSNNTLRTIYDDALRAGQTHAQALEAVEREEQAEAVREGERRRQQNNQNNRNAAAAAAAAAGPPAEEEEGEEGEEASTTSGNNNSENGNNQAARNKAARNKATKNMPSPAGLFGENSDNNFVNNAARNKAAKNKEARNKATENMPSPAGLFGENADNFVNNAARNNAAPKPVNKNAKTYSAKNVKNFSQKLSRLQLNLQALQRGKKTPERAKRINSIKANIQSIKAVTGRNSNTIKSTLTKLRNKYANVNTQKRLTVGGKKKYKNNTIKKSKSKSRISTFRKNKK